MCIEYVIALAISIGMSIIGIVTTVKLSKLEDEYEKLMEWCCDQEDTIREQWGEIEQLNDELLKKDSLISILRLEIEEKENV